MFVTRDMVEADKPFIFATMLRGLYFGTDTYRDIDKATFFHKYHDVVAALLNRSRVSVACLADDSDVVLGYSIYDGDRLHFCFTKKAWRRLGVAKSLIPINIAKCTHLTKLGKSIKPSAWIYDPFF